MQLTGNSEDTMEVLDGQQIELPIKDPFLFVDRLAGRAVSVAAGVIVYARIGALIALLNVPAQESCFAVSDHFKHRPLMPRKRIIFFKTG